MAYWLSYARKYCSSLEGLEGLEGLVKQSENKVCSKIELQTKDPKLPRPRQRRGGIGPASLTQCKNRLVLVSDEDALAQSL